MAPAKQGLDQHAYLHQVWPPPHCCLCNSEAEIAAMRDEIRLLTEAGMKLGVEIAELKARLADYRRSDPRTRAGQDQDQVYEREKERRLMEGER